MLHHAIASGYFDRTKSDLSRCWCVNVCLFFFFFSSNRTCKNRYLRVPLDSDKITMIFVIYIASISCFRSRKLPRRFDSIRKMDGNRIDFYRDIGFDLINKMKQESNTYANFEIYKSMKIRGWNFIENITNIKMQLQN